MATKVRWQRSFEVVPAAQNLREASPWRSLVNQVLLDHHGVAVTRTQSSRPVILQSRAQRARGCPRPPVQWDTSAPLGQSGFSGRRTYGGACNSLNDRTDFGAVTRDQKTGTMEHVGGARLRALPVVVIILAATLSACSTHPTSPLSATSSDLAACQAYDVQYQSQSGSLPPEAVPHLFQLLGKADNATLRADGKSMQSEVEKVYTSDPSSPQRTQATAAFNAATHNVTSTCRAMGDAPTP